MCKKLKVTKGNLYVLNNKHYGHISERAKAAKLELDRAERQLQEAPFSASFLENVVHKK